MLFIANWLVIIVFWYFVYRSWRGHQQKLAIACSALWIVARIWLPGNGLNGGLLFIVVAALLCLILMYADLLRRASPAPQQIESVLPSDQADE